MAFPDKKDHVVKRAAKVIPDRLVSEAEKEIAVTKANKVYRA